MDFIIVFMYALENNMICLVEEKANLKSPVVKNKHAETWKPLDKLSIYIWFWVLDPKKKF